MMIANYDLLQLGLEQGNISSSGDTEDNTRVRSVGYIEISAFSTNATLLVTSSTGKDVQINFIGYSSRDSSATVCNLYWYNSPRKFDITSYSDIKYFRVVLKYSDNSEFLPSEIAIANAEIEYPPPWIVEDNRLTHIELSEPLTGKYIVEPYPPFWWYVQDGRLTHVGLPEPISTIMSEPYPPFWWYVQDGKLIHVGLPERVNLGAFADCTNLRRVIIPPSVKYIGEYAFANTALTSVTIARDCEFFPTSFPPRCIINYYN